MTRVGVCMSSNLAHPTHRRMLLSIMRFMTCTSAFQRGRKRHHGRKAAAGMREAQEAMGDRYFPRRVFQGVGERIAGAEVVDVGASKHKVQLERAGAVNRAIERFIADGRPGSRPSWRGQTAQPRTGSDHPWLKTYDAHVPATIPLPRPPRHPFLETTADRVPDPTGPWF